jgi:hypothetical protein
MWQEALWLKVLSQNFPVVIEEMLHTFIQMVLGSIVGGDTSYTDWGFLVFPQFLQANSGAVSRLSHNFFLLNTFSSSILLSDPDRHWKSSYITHKHTRTQETRQSWQTEIWSRWLRDGKALAITTRSKCLFYTRSKDIPNEKEEGNSWLLHWDVPSLHRPGPPVVPSFK